MPPVFRHVPLHEIDLADDTFVVTYRPDLHALHASVAQVGVLTPLHLRQPAPDAPLQVVCGTKRLLACQATGQTLVPALVYTAADLSPARACLLALHEHLGSRVLNAVEKGRVLQRLQTVCGYASAVLMREYCPRLGLPPRLETLRTYQRLITLDDALQAAVVDGALPLETALWIGAYANEERAPLLALFTGLHVGINRAREFASLLDDLCQREVCGPAALLEQLGIPAILHDPQRPGPQKLDHIRQRLRQARYPRLSAHEQRFQDAVRRLHLPPQLSLRPAPSFDGPYQVTVTFQHRQELHDAAQRLVEAAGHEAIGVLEELA